MADQEFVTMLTDRFESSVAAARKAAKAYETASKPGGVTFNDAFRKSEDPQVIDIRKSEEDLTKQAQALREQARSRLVEIGVLKASAATSEESAKTAKSAAFDKVRAQLKALATMLDDEPETVQTLTDSVIGEGKLLGKPRGRAASGSSEDSETDESESDESTSDDEVTEDSSE